MYRGKYQYPEIRRNYKANCIECKELISELELLSTNITSLDEFKRLVKINKRIDLLFDYQIAHYDKAYELKQQLKELI